MSLRIAIFGQAPFGRDVTARLAEAGHEIVGVHVPPDAGSRVDPLAALAEERGWPLARYKGCPFPSSGKSISTASALTAASVALEKSSFSRPFSKANG